AISARIPFGSKTPGGALSDHFGYTVEYRLAPSNTRLASRDTRPTGMAEKTAGSGGDTRLHGSAETVSAR
ncbi:MAG: hypothetical protein CL819_10760, partial [Croceicoccus sp.]|nr:hypothetical protein [Croceicoccus sp.]